MNTYIALFRGINVGGHHKLPMKELRALMEELGHQRVNTYIQTGNVVFQSNENDKNKIAELISSRVKTNHGFKPDVMLLELDDMKEAIASNPYPEGEKEPKTLHLSFLAVKPDNPDLDSLKEIKSESERFELKDKVFYLHAPEGIGRSKLAGKIEKELGVSATARNWRTVTKIMGMAEEVAES